MICATIITTYKREEGRKRGNITQPPKQGQRPIYSFIYVLKSSETRRQYLQRLKLFFDFLDLTGTLEENSAENTWTNQDRILNGRRIVLWSSLILTSKELDVKNLLRALNFSTIDIQSKDSIHKPSCLF